MDPSPRRAAALNRVVLQQVVAALLLATAPATRADLPADGWPQARRDARLSGATPEPALQDPIVRWSVPVGGALSGEPIVAGCQLHVVEAGGDLVALNARSGAESWRVPTLDAPCLAPTPVRSELALDAAGTLLVGTPADAGLARLRSALREIGRALASYAIDHAAYPDGTDLAAQLVPTYTRALPQNPCASRPMRHSDTPSPGDHRYRRIDGGNAYYLGAWWTDDALLPASNRCGSVGGHQGLDPAWPMSSARGGRPQAFDSSDGASLWASDEPGPASAVSPTVTPAGVAWAITEDFPEAGDAVRRGQLRVTDLSGAVSWQDLRPGPLRGPAAHDTGTSRLVAASAAEETADAFNVAARRLSTACESYAIDENEYPPTGELVDLLVPVYLPCMPDDIFDDGAAVWSATPSAGDYWYESPTFDSYRLGFWASDDGPLVAVIDTGTFEDVAEDRPASVTAWEADGSVAWIVPVTADPSVSVTPVALTGDGGVVLAASTEIVSLDLVDGSERWRTPVGERIEQPLAIVPGDAPADPPRAIVGVTVFGTAVALDASGDELWRVPFGVPVGAPPTVTSDGVTYLPDREGILHAVALDGSVLWEVDAGGPDRAGLTTAAIQAGRWIHVGRDDGVVVALVDRSTAGRPGPVGNVLRPILGEVGFEWPLLEPPADVLGWHPHLRRWPGLPLGPGTQLVPDGSLVTSHLDATAPSAPLLTYRLRSADCGEIESR